MAGNLFPSESLDLNLKRPIDRKEVMKKITLFTFTTFCLFCSGPHAQDDISHNRLNGKFQVQQVDEDFEMGGFKEVNGVQILEIKDQTDRTSAKKLPSSELVYQIVRAHLSYDLIKDWDQLEYDRFYIRLNSLKTADLIKKYEGLDIKQIDAMKAEFKKYE